MVPSNFIGKHTPLQHGDIVLEAAMLQVRTAIIHAFSDTETGATGGFFPTGEPAILFEARWMHLLTGGRYDKVAPNVSSPVWDRSLYGAAGVYQYHRLRQAMALDRSAALQSCSIGRYQIMGANYRMVGFVSIDDMWATFCDSERAHLRAFGAFCSARGMVPAMRRVPPDYVWLAVAFNGTGERANHYDEKLEASDHHYDTLGEGQVPAPLLAGRSRVEAPHLIGLAA